MKFLKGLLTGALVGFAIGTAMTAEQRNSVIAATRRRAAPVKDAINNNVGQVASTIADEAASKIDTVGDAVADTIASDTVAS